MESLCVDDKEHYSCVLNRLNPTGDNQSKNRHSSQLKYQEHSCQCLALESSNENRPFGFFDSDVHHAQIDSLSVMMIVINSNTLFTCFSIVVKCISLVIAQFLCFKAVNT